MEYKLEVNVDSKRIEEITAAFLMELHKKINQGIIEMKKKPLTDQIAEDYKSSVNLLFSIESILVAVLEEPVFRQFVKDSVEKTWAWEKETQ